MVTNTNTATNLIAPSVIPLLNPEKIPTMSIVVEVLQKIADDLPLRK